MDDLRKISFLKVFTILVGVPFSANMIAVVAMMPIYKIIRSADDWKILTRVLEGTNEILMVFTFLVPFTIINIYLYPVLRPLLASGKNETVNVIKKRIINSPLVISMITIAGWIVMAVGFISVMKIKGIEIPNRVPIKFFIEMILIGSLCFVICYYMLEFLTRKFLVSSYFQENRISDVKKTIHLSIRSRFYIYFFAVAFFPLFLLNNIFLVQETAAELKIQVVIISLVVIILGIFLTFIFSRSYQNPLIVMKYAARNIQDGRFDINIPVISNDEVGKLCEGINSMASGLKEKEFIKDTFGKIVDPRVRDFLLQGNMELGGEMKEVTILFSDIRSFTATSEKMEPDKVVAWLNRYFDKMSRCITDEKGLVNKYIGDAIMAIFGAPINQEDHADAAVRAAHRMIDELEELNREFSADQLPPISIGIGIHTGPVLAGNIGSSDRMEYTVIGDAVNVASRLESLTKDYQKPILMSETTSKALKDKYSMQCLNKVSIRGKEEPMDLYYCE